MSPKLSDLFENDFESMSGAVMASKDPETIKCMCKAFYFIGAERIVEISKGAEIEPLREFGS